MWRNGVVNNVRLLMTVIDISWRHLYGRGLDSQVLINYDCFVIIHDAIYDNATCKCTMVNHNTLIDVKFNRFMLDNITHFE